jgi:hypothetical protein
MTCREEVAEWGLQNATEADWLGVQSVEEDMYLRCPPVGWHTADSIRHFMYN